MPKLKDKYSKWNFNSRPHEGDDLNAFGVNTDLEKFQFTSPRGGRLDLSIFNDITVDISIHVPTRGTTMLVKMQTQSILFQFTSPRGGRHTT